MEPSGSNTQDPDLEGASPLSPSNPLRRRSLRPVTRSHYSTRSEDLTPTKEDPPFSISGADVRQVWNILSIHFPSKRCHGPFVRFRSIGIIRMHKAFLR